MKKFPISSRAILLITFSVILYVHGRKIDQLARTQDQTLKIASSQISKLKAATAEIEAVRKALHIQDVQKVTVTAYTPSVDECDNDPEITASMKHIRPGTVAVSRDLFKKGWVFGKKIYIQGIGIFEILDLMNERYTDRIDIVMFSKKDAEEFGVKSRIAALLKI